jgi:N-acetylglucosamine kinase-like BadF-type ATPase
MPADTPINTLTAVNPKAVRIIREAFEDAVKTVQECRGAPSDDTRAKLARQIVELARCGERDAIRLRDGALTALHISP